VALFLVFEVVVQSRGRKMTVMAILHLFGESEMVFLLQMRRDEEDLWLYLNLELWEDLLVEWMGKMRWTLLVRFEVVRL